MGELVQFPPELCPTCGGETLRVEAIQMVLLRGAGYGAALKSVFHLCDRCKTARESERGDVIPSTAAPPCA